MSVFWAVLLLTAASAWPQSPISSAKLNGEEQKALKFINQAEKELLLATQESTKIQWAYYTNITDYNEQKQLENQVMTFLDNKLERKKMRRNLVGAQKNGAHDIRSAR